MTEFLSNSRKRIRSHSNEAPFEVQSKHFINQHILDQRDASKMKQIHGKFQWRCTTTKKQWKTISARQSNTRVKICLLCYSTISILARATTIHFLRISLHEFSSLADKTIQLLFKNANTPNNNNEENVITDKLAQMRSIRLIGGGVIKPLAGQQVVFSSLSEKHSIFTQ